MKTSLQPPPTGSARFRNTPHHAAASRRLYAPAAAAVAPAHHQPTSTGQQRASQAAPNPDAAHANENVSGSTPSRPCSTAQHAALRNSSSACSGADGGARLRSACASVAAALVMGLGAPQFAEAALSPTAAASIYSAAASAQQLQRMEELDLPASSVSSLVDLLVRNEEFIAALVNSEAFLDRLAGDDSIVKELERRHDKPVAVKARRTLASELVMRQQILDELKTRGPEAVVALAGEARSAIEEVDMKVAPSPAAKPADVAASLQPLVKLETAMELLEDSEELMMAVEGQDMDADVAFSGEQRFRAMEGAVADSEQLLEQKLAAAEQAVGPGAVQAERQLQAAVRDLMTASDVASEQALEQAVSEPSSGSGAKAAASKAAASKVERSGEVVGAFDRVVLSLAQLQGFYGDAVRNAGSTLAKVESAAEQGVGLTKELLDSKKVEMENTLDAISAAVPSPPPLPTLPEVPIQIQLTEEEAKRGSLAVPGSGLILFIAYQFYRAVEKSKAASPPAAGPAGVQSLFVAPEEKAAETAESKRNWRQ